MMRSLRTMMFPKNSYPAFTFKYILLGWLLLVGSAIAGESQAWLLVTPNREDAVMTLSAQEKEGLVKAGWTIDGTGMVQTESVPDAAQLHRMIRTRPDGIDRMLESDESKVAAWKKAGFVDEGLLGYVAAKEAPERIPVVQFSKGEQRLWLMDAQSQKTAEEKGWKRQGIQFWLWPISGVPATKK